MRVRRLGLVLVALLACGHAASFLGAGPFDDDFIVYRYARNWVEGHGIVFNPGERVEGYSAPLWMMLMALVIKLGGSPVGSSLLLSIASTGVAAFALASAWRRRFPDSRGYAPALLLAAMPAFAWHGVVGLGTTLLAALLSLWLASYERAAASGRVPVAASLFLALACLVRQECVVFAVPFTWIEWRRRRSPVLLLPWIALVGWTAFRLGYYGRLLPMPFYTKRLPLDVDLSYGLRYLGRSTLECGVALLWLLAPLALRARGGPREPLRVFLYGGLAHLVYVVWVGGDFMPFARFFLPALPVGLYLASIGVRSVLVSPRARVSACVGLLIALQWTWLERPQLFGEHRFFEERWAALGRHFERTVASNTRVAISPIGAFGWYSRLPLIDVLGLTNDVVWRQEPALDIAMKGHHRFDGAWVVAQRPEIVILGNGVRQPDSGRLDVNPWERTIVMDPEFVANYEQFQMPIEGSEPLDIFKRKDASQPPGARRISPR
jgi:hypothetical protein